MLCDADGAMRKFEAGAERLDDYAKPHVYHWIGNMQALGTIDRTVTADHPTAVVFARGDKRTHVAYNMTDHPVTVRFSDGVAVETKPGKSATSR